MDYNFEEFCKDYKNIENYEIAKADNFKNWICHHRRGADISVKELIELDMYYNISADELIFVTKAEHNTLHFKGKHQSEELKRKRSEALKGKPKSKEHKKKLSEAWDYDKHFTEETRKKLSEAGKGRTPWNKGKPALNKGVPMSDEQKKKISEAKKDISEETRNKIGEASKGRNSNKHWYTNWKDNKYCYECPEGYTLGRFLVKRSQQ